jgi:outer membrane protein assembly factor BamB
LFAAGACGIYTGVTTGFMTRFLTAILLLGSLAIPIERTLPAETGDLSSERYFRSDLGVASTSGPLPSDLNAPETLRWRVAVDSGQSTPLVCAGKIFLTTYRAETGELATLALDEATGETLWKRPVPVAQIETFHPQMGNAAVATPACDGRRLYVFFGSHGLICYDLAGNTVWDHPMGPFMDEYGAGSSPILIDGKVILNQDHDKESFLTAIDSSTGRTVWTSARPDAVRSYATPAIWSHHGRKELLVAGALELASHDPANGQKLWSTHGLARIVIPIPVPSGDMIYMASWAPGGDAGKRLTLDTWPAAIAKWDIDKDGQLSKSEINDGEVLNRFFRMDLDQDGKLNRMEWERHAAFFTRAQNAVLALKPEGRGELGENIVAWKYQRGIPYVATPLLDRGILWMVKDGGIVTKLDAATGRVLQEERLPGLGNYYASPVAGDGKVYFASEPGVVGIVANQTEWKVISSREFREKIHASPVIERDRLYIRTEKALYCFGTHRPR